MMNRLAVRLLQPINTSVISILGFYNIAFGLWLALPFHSTLCVHFLPETYLGVASIIAGLIVLYGATTNRFKTLYTGSLVVFYYWFTTAWLLLYDNWQSSEWITALMIACYSGFVALNIKANRKFLLNLHDK